MNQKCFRNTVIVRLSLISLAVVFYLSASLTVKAVNLVQEFYLPMPEPQIYQANSAIISGTGSTIASTFSIVVTAGGTVIYYDQWEDGYETDLSNPSQPSTQIWGDGNTNNGVAPGYPNDILPAGAVITLTNSVSLPRNPSTLLWDARDRIAASKALVVSRAAWPVNPGPVFAGAAGVLSTLDYGTNYVSPVGQDMTNGLMKYVGMFVMAAQNNTALTIDPNGNGVGTTNVVLNQGESYLVNGGIKKGGRVTASKPVQADLLIGHVGASYASDWFTLYPVEEWSSTYFTSVGTAASGNPAYVYLFNPNSNALVINYSTQSGSGSFAVPGTNGVFQFPMPVGSGGSFASAGGQNFFAISTVAANPAADTAYNWGFTLVPEAALTTEAVVGWGPGSADGTVDGSPVWVTPLAATRLYVDYKGDHLGPLTDPNGNHYDTNYDLTALQSKKIYDPNKNQTGMRIYTVNGTLITAAWGEDPDVAAPGNPYIDAGTTVLPFPVPVLKKTAAIVTDVAPTNLSIGDTIAYTVEIDNKGLLPLGNTVIIDAPSTNLLYVTNSTTYNGSPVPDSVTGTAFPLDESGFTIPVILSRGTSAFTYLCKVTASGTVSNSVNIGGSSIFSATSLAPAPASGAACNLNFTDAGGAQTGFYSAGGNIFVTMTNAAANTATNSAQAITVSVQNVTHGDVENIVLAETGTNTGVFRNTNGLPTSTSAGLGQQNGILNVAAGDVLAVTYVDPNYGDTCTANAMILVPALTKQLYLSVNGSTNGVQALNRVDPAAYAHSPTRTSVDLGSGGGGIALDSVTTVSNTASLTATFSHTTSSGANRLMLVGVSINRLTGGTTFETPTNVTYAGVPLVLVGGRTNAVSQEGVMWMFALVNPPAGTANVVVNWNQAQTDGDVIGCATFTGVNQTTPYGPFFSSTNTSTAVSLVVPSAPGELVFDTVIVRSSNFGASGSPGANQTALWKTYFNARVGAGASTQPGAAMVTNTWTAAAAVDCAIGAVSIKPVNVGGSTNVTTFTQTQGFCSNFVMPSNNLVVITNYITVTNGVMPANPAVTASLNYNGTNVLTLSNPTYSAAGSNLVWSGLLTSNVTIPAGQVISYVISNGQSGVAFHVDYDSTNKPSKIILPASTVIAINTLGVYDAPYPGGNLVTAPVAGSTLYVRASVSDPFGSYDITSLGLAITAPSPSANVSTNLNDTSVVMNDGCSKIYEFTWTTGPTTGGYAIAATANEGTEGVTASAGAGVSLIFLDLGTPSTTEFTSGNNGPATNGYPASATGSVCVRVTDLNRNTNAAIAENIVATVGSSAGDSEMLTLTETGTNTGIFTACVTTSTNGVNVPNDGTLYAPAGSVLTVNYSDPTDPTDNTSATATIKPLPGVAGVVMSKTLVSPSGGQVGVGQPVTYNLQVVNTGSTPLTNPVVTDNFPSAKLSYASATKTPTTIAAGVLTWTNLGSLTPGQSTNFTVTFTTLATGSTTNSATVNGGAVTNSSSATLLITHAALNVTKILLNPTNTPVSISSNVVFRITIQNVGDTAIPMLPFEDNFSGAYYQFVSATIAPNGTGAGSLVWTNLAYPVALATNAIITNDVTMKVVGQGSPANNTAVADYAVDVFGNPVPVSSTTTGVVTSAASILGHVYNDLNHSGVFTNGDAGLGGVALQLFTDPNGDGNPSDGTLVQLVTTDVSGYYELLNLTLGHYVVVETDLPGYASSAPANNRLALNLTTLTASANNNFFDYLPSPASYSTISGTVWNDANGNGTNDVAETGLANVAMDLVQDVNTNGLVDAGEPVVASVTTDANGNYSFAGVTPGNYVVRENVLFSYYKTGDAQPPNDGLVAINASGGAMFTNVWFLQHLNQSPLATDDFISLAENTAATIYPLGNDTDPDGNSLTITAITTTNGAVNFANGTNVLFTPDTNFLGTLTMNYSISDGHGGSAGAVIFVTVTNVPPLASPDFYSMTENTTNAFSPLVNDVLTTPGGSLAIIGVSPTNGVATIAGTNVIFTPALNFVGTATIGYTITDGIGGTNSSVITVTVTNVPPVALGQSVATTENTARGIILAGSDPAGGALTFIIVSGPANGVVTAVNTNTGAVTYTPAANYLGADSFSFRVNNGYNNSPAATVSITVTNVPPLANADSYGIGENSGTNVFSPLVNDTVRTPGGSLAIIGVSPTNGTASISGTNVWFVPSTNFLGTATIGYTIVDNIGGTNFGLITVSVTNRPPVAVNDFASTPKNMAVTIPVLVNDFDPDGNPLTITSASPTNGAANIAGTNVVFTPATNFLGTAFVGYAITDGNGGTNFALIAISVTNRPPVAVNDFASVPENVVVTVPVLANDSDPDGDALTVVSVSPTNGIASISGTNVVFTPATNYVGPATIGYGIADGFGGTNFALVTILVTNRPPVANPDSYSVGENSTNTLNPLVNDLVITPGGTLSIISVAPTNGVATVAGTNVNFTPTLNFVGVATIGYTIIDNVGGTNSSVVTVNVTNAPPTAFGQSLAITENAAKGITLTGSDPTSLPLTFVLISGPASGMLTAINTNTGAVVYTPNTNYTGTDTFTFRVNNGFNNSPLATVNILVTNIPPVANPDNYTVSEDSTNTLNPLANDVVLTPGGDLRLVSISATNGTATISGTNVIFIPNNSYTGPATIGYMITDGIGGTNSSVITITVLAVADISVSKSGPANVFAATNFVYTITVTNLGPGAAAGLSVTDNLPSAVSFVSATAGATLNGSQLVWTNLGSLPASATTNLAVTVTAPLTGVSLTNFAGVGSPTSDPNSTNNTSAPVVTTVTPIANLVIGKSAPASVSASGSLTYSISVTNFGPSSASSVMVTDALPAGVTFVSASGSGANDSGVVNWDLGTLVNGQASNVTVTVTAPASGLLTNVASVSSPTPDTNIFDNVTPPVITSVALLADLQIGKTAPASVLAAGSLTYTISVTNFGPSSASSVVVTDALPVGVTFVSASGGGFNNAGAVIWPLGSLANGQVSNVTVTVTAPASGSLTNLASVNSPTGDPNPLNNLTPPVITSVTPLADLQIGKTAPPTVLAANNLTYSISVTNFGPSSASSVVVTDPLPVGVTFVSANGGGVNNAGAVMWSLGNLANGQVSNVTVTVKAPAVGSLTNTASVSSPTGDTNILNNLTPPVITDVTPVADVSVSKTGPAGIVFGTNFTYMISVTNFGPSTATSLSVTDNLPAGLVFVSSIPATTTNAIGQIIWSGLGNLAAGTGTNLTLTVISTSRGTVTNIASGGSPTLDPNLTNNLTPPVVTTVTNNPPLANPDSYAITENTSCVFSPLVNDVVQTPAGSLSLIGVAATNGVATISETNILFTPATNFVGLATIGYMISDNVGGTNSSLVTVLVTNIPPVANPDNYAISENTTNLFSPLVNDVVLTSGGTLMILAVNATNGTASIAGTNVSFVPALNFIGVATIGYTITDNIGGTNSSLMSIVVTNLPPGANPDSYAITENTTNSFSPLVNDVLRTPGGSLAILGVSPTNGVATINGTNVIFTPTLNFLGVATIGYTITDGIGGTNSSLITVTVTNLPPLANPDVYSMAKNTTNTLSPLVNDVVRTSGGTLAIIGVSPTNGTASISGTNVIFTPTLNFLGLATIGYTITDNVGGTNAGLITVNVTNRPPVALNDFTSTPKNVAVTAPVLTNDADPDGDALTIVSVSPTNGTASISGTNVVFTPATNFLGTATVGYVITDGFGGTNFALLTISVTNRPPVAVNDFASAPENVAVTVPVTANDSDPDDDALTVVSVSPTNGTAVISGTNVIFTPATNFVGTATIGYAITDGFGGTNFALITVGITNVPPLANPDFYSMTENTTNAFSPLVNDLVVTPGGSLTIIGVSPTNGIASISGTNIIFTPALNFVGTSTIGYTITDAIGGTNSSVITVNVTNVPPVAFGQFVATAENTARGITLTGSDPAGGAMTFIIVSGPANGALTAVNTNTGAVTYTPDTNYLGADSFTFRVNNGYNNSPIATVSITVTNIPPLANPDFYGIGENSGTNVLSPLVNDAVRTPGGSLTIIGVSPTNGVAIISGTNVLFVPNTNFLGTATIGYTIIDNVGGTNFGLIAVSVTNHPPSAVNDFAGTPKNIAVTIPVLVNDSDPDGNPLTIISVSPTNGTANIAGTNVVFSPATNFLGTAFVGYAIADGNGGTNFALITISVTNRPPLAVNDFASAPENVAVTIPVLVNDSDPDGDALTIVGVSPTNGIASLSGTNVVFTPATNFVGTATIGYTITDGFGGTNSALITVGVTNRPPVANPDNYAIGENTTNTLVPLTNDLVVTPGGTLSILSVSPTNGIASISGTNVIFTPALNFLGVATIGYTITDNVGGTNSSVITVTVTNVPPLANSDSYAITENTTNSFSPLVNDVVRTPGGSLTLLSVSPTNGVATIIGTNVLFTPTLNFIGVATIGYTITDGIGGTNSSLVTVLVTNLPPLANPDTYAVSENSTNTLSPLVNDVLRTPGGSLTIVGLSPTNGTATISGTNVLFTPALNFIGVATIGYTITDGIGGTNSSLITVTVTNIPPLANSDNYFMAENTTNSFGPLLNDVVRTPGGTLSLVSVTATNGVATISGTNVVFVPTLNFLGVATIGYAITDNVGGTNSAVITVTVTNVPPIANPDNYSMAENRTNTFSPLVNDLVLTPGGALAIISVSPTNGIASIVGTNVIFTPTVNFLGVATIGYTITDNVGGTNHALITIVVTNVPPLANPDSYAITENTTNSFSPLLNDVVRTSGGSLTILSVSPTNGIASISGTNVMFTPALNFLGMATIGYTITDNVGGTNSAVITVLVTNLPPLANPDNYTVLENSTNTLSPLVNDVVQTPGGVLALVGVSPTNGTATISGTNMIFTPANNFTGTATIGYVITDGIGGTGSSVITVTVQPVADVAVTKRGPATVYAGTNFDYVITVTNLGPGAAASLSVTDDLPSAVSFVSATAGAMLNGGQLVWTNLGSLAAGAATNLTVTVTAPVISVSLTNVASGGSPMSDPNPTNNTSLPVLTAVTPVADLAIGKTAPATVFATGNLSYTISVTNFGPSSATGVVVTDALPAGVTFVSASGGGANNSGVVNWNLGTLASGQISNLTLTVTAPASGMLTNVASVNSPTLDPKPTNNLTPPVVTSVTPLADVAVSKRGPAGILFGTNFTYTISVTNFGPSTATALVITDSLPAGLVFLSSVPATVTNAGNQVVWSALGDLAAGAGTNLTVNVISILRGSVTNVASGGSPTLDPVPTNNVTPPVVTAVTNNPPLANPDSYAITENTTGIFSPLLNDVVQTPGGSLTLIGVSPTNGVAAISGTNIFFTPATNFLGLATIGYTITDNVGGTSSSLITVLVTNIPPAANPDSYAMAENTTNTFSPLVNDLVLTPGGSLSLIGVVATNGTATIAGTNVVFTPALNFLGMATIGYTIIDNIGGTNSSVITVTVTNVPPVANPDNYAMSENTTNSFSPLINDAALTPGGILSIIGVSPTNGTASIVGTNILFTPATNFIGTATIGYTITDGIGGTNHSLITVLVTNVPPLANPDTDAMTENTPRVLYPLLNDQVRTPGGTLRIVSVNPTNGVVVNWGTNLIFTPTTNFVGVATIGYTITDNVGGTNSSLITVTVTNIPPLANPDSYFMAENTTNVFSPLINDLVRTPGGSLSIIGVNPTNGTASIAGTNVSFTPALNFLGVATIGYTITDNIGGTNSSVITITVTNVLPVANPDTYFMAENTTNTFSPLANDLLLTPGGTLTIIGVSPTNGTASISGTNVIFTPTVNFLGTATIGYTISDNVGGTNSSLITVTVTNEPPLANPDVYSVAENSTNSLSPLLNDLLRTPGGSLTILGVSPTNGTATINGTNVTFVPTLNFVGVATIGYTITDNVGGTNRALITVNVTNLPPVAFGQSGTTTENTALPLLLAGSDPANHPLTFIIVTAPTNGTLTALNTNTGAVTYLPNTNYFGTDTFTFRVNNGYNDSPAATVNLTVTPVADLAVSQTGPTTGVAGSNLVFTVTVTNLGPASATNLVVTNQLATGLTFVSASAGGIYGNNLVTWTLPALAAHGAMNLTVTAFADEGGSFTNIASGTSATQDLNPANNNGSLTNAQTRTVISALADVAVFKTGGTNVFAGQTVNYVITATNAGPSTATNVVVTDTLPAGAIFLNASGSFATNNGVVTWSSVTLAPGAAATYNITLLAPPTVNSFLNIAAGTSPTADPNPTNNNGSQITSRVTTRVTPSADLVVLLAGPPSAIVGSNIVFTLTVTNAGPSTASNIVVSDSLPTNLLFVAASSGGASNNFTLTWPQILSMPVGGSTNFTFTVRSLNIGLFTQIASAISSTADPNPTNNIGVLPASQAQTLIALPQFSVFAGTPVFNPQTGLYEEQVTVTNTGTITVAGIRLYVGGLRSGVSLWNATGTNATGPFVLYNAPLDPGGTAHLVLEFYNPSRLAFTNTLSVEAITVVNLPMSGITNSIPINKLFTDTRTSPTRFIIEWDSVPGKIYTVLYSPTVNATNWFVATPTVTATANITQWYDDGPPKTTSAPASVGSRFYRVIKN